MTQPLKIVYFAWLRERVGLAQEEIVLPSEIHTVSELLDYLSIKSEGHAAAFRSRKMVRCAVNQAFVQPSCPLHPGDEVAFFPPVTGG